MRTDRPPLQYTAAPRRSKNAVTLASLQGSSNERQIYMEEREREKVDGKIGVIRNRGREEEAVLSASE